MVFHVDLLVSTLSSLKLLPKITHACCALQLLSAPFLVALETQIFVNNLRNWWSTDPPTSREISLTVRWLWGLSFWLSNSDSTVSTFLSVCAASAAAQKPVDSSELHQQPVYAVLRPTLVQKLCYKLPSVVTFTFLQTFWLNVVFFTERHQSCRICLLQCQNSRYFSVSNFKDEKLIKKANLHENWNMQTIF